MTRMSDARRIVGALLLVVFATLAAPVAMASETPEAMVNRLGGNAITILADKSKTPAERQTGLETLFRDGFDVPLLGQIVLGRYWRSASEQQKNEYLDVFYTFVVKTYASRLDSYAGQTFTVLGSSALNDKETLVNSVVEQPRGPALKVDWRVLTRDGEPRIVDVIIEGVSMAITHRSEFAAVIAQNGGNVDALISRLRAQITG
ncbi:MAG: ABC transporter substrate-binding protein [Pseudomonadota bacterium]|nr:ABC transporter substrate-binding protein [Pseudomonadota bacterium]